MSRSLKVPGSLSSALQTTYFVGLLLLQPVHGRQGRGVVIDDLCPTSRGSGVERRPARSRSACRLESRTASASPSRAGRRAQRRPAEDLYAPPLTHALFGRDGEDSRSTCR